MPAPKRPNTAAAAAANRRRGEETAAARLLAAGWTVQAPDDPWNEAVDWLLTGHVDEDQNIARPFWAYVDGIITREELDTFDAHDVSKRKAELEAAAKPKPKKRR